VASHQTCSARVKVVLIDLGFQQDGDPIEVKMKQKYKLCTEKKLVSFIAQKNITVIRAK